MALACPGGQLASELETAMICMQHQLPSYCLVGGESGVFCVLGGRSWLVLFRTAASSLGCAGEV